jgi:benzoyl-CoA reductase/2-hydroxyglutaryl-CoA dehydratase subunit BcrC/BadD/HgdB
MGPDALREAVKARNQIRRKLRQVDALRRGPAPRLSGVQALQVFRAGFGLSSSDYSALLDDLLNAAPSAKTVSGRPVIVSGSDVGGVALYEALEARGLRVVADDHDSGARAIGPLVDEANEPLAALAQRYANRDPAPAQWSTASRIDYLSALVRDTGAEAVIFDIPLFEHPAAWDYPAQRRALDEAGVAHVLLPPTAYLDPTVAADIAADSLSSFAPEPR